MEGPPDAEVMLRSVFFFNSQPSVGDAIGLVRVVSPHAHRTLMRMPPSTLQPTRIYFDG